MRHVHTIVTAAIDGKLNGKAMSSRANMTKLNKKKEADERELRAIQQTDKTP